MNQQVSVFNRRRQVTLTTDATADLGVLLPPHISIRGNRFALVDAAGMRYSVNTLHLDVVIVDVNPHKSKVYWGDDPFDPNAVEFIPPVCFSDNGVAPSADAQEKQARTCAECVHNERSKINEVTGNRSKPCSDRKKMAVLVLNDTGLVYQLQIPPATLKTLVKYAGQLQAMKTPGTDRKADLNDVVTRLTFVDGKNGELAFAAAAWISSVQANQVGGWTFIVNQQGQALTAPDQGLAFGTAIDDLIDSGVTDKIVGRLDKPWTGPALPAASTSALAAPVAMPAPALPAVAAPASEAPGHGGRRPGSGRKPRSQPVQAAPQPPAAAQEVFAPGQPLPTQAAPQQVPQPALPASLQMLPEQMLNPPQETRASPAPGSPAFAQPQDMTSALNEALAFAMNLNTDPR